MQFATIKGLRIEKYTLQSQNWRESAKTNKTLRLITARRNKSGGGERGRPLATRGNLRGRAAVGERAPLPSQCYEGEDDSA
jgi:hypothetical protein